MCISPNILPGGQPVRCHECWQCREQAINDWVGRNIAESKTAKACHAVTLTYGRNGANDVDHERSVVLTYSDVQKYIKLLRRHGYPVRYFATGEFGSKKGRAHWHVMLYWQKDVPPHELDRNFMEEHWPHGWSFWTRPTAHAIRYNCKYIQKDMGDDERQGHLAMSKKPPLGTAYFQKLAEQFVRQGLAPQTLEYRFPEVTRRKANGAFEVVPFMLKDRPAELFLQHFLTKWQEAYPGRHVPASDLVEEYLDSRVDLEQVKFVWKLEEAQRDYERRKRAVRRTGPRDLDDWWSRWKKEQGNGSEQQQAFDEQYEGEQFSLD